VASAPATALLQQGGLEAAVEAHLCNETLALMLERAAGERLALLVVDLAGMGRAATVWLAQALVVLAARSPGARVTLALPGTRPAGRGQLLARHLAEASERVGLEADLVCGPAPAERSAPVDDERDPVREAFDLVLVLALGGSAGIGAPWPDHPGRRWLDLADAAVLSTVDPDSIVGDLERYQAIEPAPARFRVETLDGADPRLAGTVDLDDLERARRELPHLIETARRHPWRVVVEPPSGTPGTPLACPSETAARSMAAPLAVRRTLVAGRLRLVAASPPTPLRLRGEG
jgi:hypothetical protein